MLRLQKTVVLVGMMGAGKSAVGAALARLLKVQCLDSDEEIVRAANATIPEIFERDGEPFFRDRESEVIGRLLRGTPCVLSTGGGAFMSERNRDQIRAAGVSVWLRVDLDLLWQRVRHKNTRPLLRTANPRETLRQIYERYGARRLAWGSDYPVVNYFMTYRQSLEVLRTHCGFIPSGEKELILGGNLARLLT